VKDQVRFYFVFVLNNVRPTSQQDSSKRFGWKQASTKTVPSDNPQDHQNKTPRAKTSRVALQVQNQSGFGMTWQVTRLFWHAPISREFCTQTVVGRLEPGQIDFGWTGVWNGVKKSAMHSA
jgi:hypothetical protein